MKPGSPAKIPSGMVQSYCKLTSSHCMTLWSQGAKVILNIGGMGKRIFVLGLGNILCVQTDHSRVTEPHKG
jgi:hypothetical protein